MAIGALSVGQKPPEVTVPAAVPSSATIVGLRAGRRAAVRPDADAAAVRAVSSWSRIAAAPGKSHAMLAALADHPGQAGLHRAWSVRRCRCRRGRARPPAAANRARRGRPARPRARPARRSRQCLGAVGGDGNLEPVLAGVAGARDQAGDAGQRDGGDAHERQRGGLRAEPRHDGGGGGPCRASRARSSSGRSRTPAGRLAAMWVKSTSLRLALTTRNRRSSPRFATIRSSMMPPASLVSSV